MASYFIKQMKALRWVLCKLLLDKENQVYRRILATWHAIWHSAALSLIQLVMAWLATVTGDLLISCKV